MITAVKGVRFRIGVSTAFKVLVIVLSAVCIIPLIAIILYIIKAGISTINWNFLTKDEFAGGIGNAIVGTLMIVLTASIVAVPVGILCGIFLSENKSSKLAYWCRLSVDILQGVPSIIIGIIGYIWLVGPMRSYSGLAGCAVLAIMMLPIIIRSTEETLKMLPDTLREAAFALGMPFHRVILKVILPCGFSGILSGVIISIARVAGETAPLIFTAFGSPSIETNLSKPMQTLPHLIYYFATLGSDQGVKLAWGASLVLLMWVLLLNIFTKVITRKWKVQL